MKSYLKPRVPEHEFSNFGFRKCKGKYGRYGCYYMLVRADDKVIFASKEILTVFDFSNDDPRIHKNRRYLKTEGNSYCVIKDLTEKGFFEEDR
jgi:hypothetical protein